MQQRSFCLPLATVLLSSFTGATATALTPIQPTLLPVTVTLAANNVTVVQGTAVVLTATVTPVSAPPTTGEQNPTGTIIFYHNGATEIGQSTLSALPMKNSAMATLTAQNLPGGQDAITAYYAGDGVFGSGTSSPLALNIQAFTLTPAASNPATNLDIVQGNKGSESFVVTSVGGYAGQVQVICSVALEDDMTCTPTPQQITPTATATFAVKTFVSGGPLYAAVDRPHGPDRRWKRVASGASLAALTFLLLPYGRKARRQLRRGRRGFLVLTLLLAALLTANAGCNSKSVLAPFGTPLGVATLKVTASAYANNTVTSQTVYFTVNVKAP